MFANNYAQSFGGYGAAPTAAYGAPTVFGAPAGYAAPAPTVFGAPAGYGAPVGYGAAPTSYGYGSPGYMYGSPTVVPLAPGSTAMPIAAPVAAAPVKQKKAKAPKVSKENKALDKEYAERIQAENALAYGNYAGATWHDARADRWAVKADKTHFRSYNKGRLAQPYAFHPIAPAGGIAAVQPGTFGQGPALAAPQGMPLFADATQVGLYGAQTPVTSFGGYGGAYGGSLMPGAGAYAMPTTYGYGY